MIRSMTAFASAERDTGHGKLAIELRSVNHRYLELSPRLPEELRSLEPQLRERVAARVQRGKVDLTVRLKPNDVAAAAITLDPALVDRLAQTAHELAARFPNFEVDFTGLLGWPGVLLERTSDYEALKRDMMELLDTALTDFVDTRSREGARLGVFIADRLDGIERLVASVREHLPDVRQAMRARLDQKLSEIKQPIEPGRIEQEIVLSLSRMDVDEELDRLSAHIAEARRILKLGDAVGRRLDFLMQEFNREANTLGSKAADPRTTNAAVELKVLIEQMREQIQNIE